VFVGILRQRQYLAASITAAIKKIYIYISEGFLNNPELLYNFALFSLFLGLCFFPYNFASRKRENRSSPPKPAS